MGGSRNRNIFHWLFLAWRATSSNTIDNQILIVAASLYTFIIILINEEINWQINQTHSCTTNMNQVIITLTNKNIFIRCSDQQHSSPVQAVKHQHRFKPTWWLKSIDNRSVNVPEPVGSNRRSRNAAEPRSPALSLLLQQQKRKHGQLFSSSVVTKKQNAQGLNTRTHTEWAVWRPSDWPAVNNTDTHSITVSGF